VEVIDRQLQSMGAREGALRELLRSRGGRSEQLLDGIGRPTF